MAPLTTSVALLILSILSYYGVRLALTDCDLTVGAATDQKIEEKFANKRVWVTGASSGIGKALAFRIGKIRGTTVLVSARSGPALLEVQKQIQEQGGKCEVLVMDLADLPSLKDKVKLAREILGGDVDILVNNGGISQRSLARDSAFETDMRILNVDFVSATILTKTLLDYWHDRPNKELDQKGIISISSLAGKMGVPLRTFYCASKFALIGFMDSLRTEVSARQNVIFTNACPGSVATNIAFNALVGSGEKFGAVDDHIVNGMHVDRCVNLILRGFANELPEIWTFGNAKEKGGAYLGQYFPTIFQNFVVKGDLLMKRNHEEMLKAARQKTQ